MCITLLSTTHPHYPLILLSNRDEFLARPTHPAAWWPAPHTHILGGRDLHRPARDRGSWLALTRDGRLANLTNFRDDAEGVADISREKSRGALVREFLAPEAKAKAAGEEEEEDDGRRRRRWRDEEEFARYLIDDVGVQDVGGFTLLFGWLPRPRKSSFTTTSDAHGSGSGSGSGTSSPSPPPPPGLALLSNRTARPHALPRIATTATATARTGRGETHAISNSHFGDLSWPKVVHGEQLLKQAIAADVQRHASHPHPTRQSQDHFLAALFDLLSVDTLRGMRSGETFGAFAGELRNSIFIPLVGGGRAAAGERGADGAEGAGGAGEGVSGGVGGGGVGQGPYGTVQQSVLLVDREGHVVFVERTLYDGAGRRMESGAGQGERRFEFDIED